MPTLDPAKTIIDGKMSRHGFVNDRINNDARYASAAVGELYSAKANDNVPSTTSVSAQADPTSICSSVGYASATEELAEVFCWTTPGTC